MKKVSSDTIRKMIKEIFFLYDFAKQCHRITNYFINPETLDEKEIYNKCRNVQLVNFVFWRTHIIEVAKLVTNSGNQNYNIFSFLDKLKTSQLYNDSLGEKISLWEIQLDNCNATIEKITKLRNKAYAHTDKNYQKVLNENQLNYEEIESLYNIIDTIIFEVYGLFDWQASTDLEYEDGNIHIMNNIIDRNKWLTGQFFKERR
ncbi:hypothetical protein L3073_02055 [Ancylomarina sp. DW003]|nr:hypothetical protein [Ancylomarina sp. DW003]MDE5420985.1 hypothetical protein [Ancylomarina sp. DW003]